MFATEVTESTEEVMSQLDERTVLRRIAHFMDLLKATTPEQIADAVFDGIGSTHGNGLADAKWNDKWITVRLPDGGYGYGPFRHDRPNVGYGLKLWQEREGKPYQADLEAHVAQFEFPKYLLPPWLTRYDAIVPVYRKLRRELCGPWYMFEPSAHASLIAKELPDP